MRRCNPEEEGFFPSCKVGKCMTVCMWYMACCKEMNPLGSLKGPDEGGCMCALCCQPFTGGSQMCLSHTLPQVQHFVGFII